LRGCGHSELPLRAVATSICDHIAPLGRVSQATFQEAHRVDLLRVGIIGCGALGVVHAKRFAELPGCDVIALSDPDAAAMARAASALPRRPRVQTTDYHALLDAGLDAVCIASPDAYHVPQLLDALAANLHVLCEKPLTPDPD